jgi:hypothetical protein
VERLLIDSSPHCTSTFFTSSVTVFRRKTFSAMDYLPYYPDLAPGDFWLFPCRIVLKRKCFLDIENIKSSVKKI